MRNDPQRWHWRPWARRLVCLLRHPARMSHHGVQSLSWTLRLGEGESATSVDIFALFVLMVVEVRKSKGRRRPRTTFSVRAGMGTRSAIELDRSFLDRQGLDLGLGLFPFHFPTRFTHHPFAAMPSFTPNAQSATPALAAFTESASGRSRGGGRGNGRGSSRGRGRDTRKQGSGTRFSGSRPAHSGGRFKGGRRGKSEAVEFDDEARREYLTGFRKRKQARQEAARKLVQEKAKQELKDSRTAVRSALARQY